MSFLRRKLFPFDSEMIRTTCKMAWPAVIESFFGAFAGLVDSLMVSSMGKNKVAAVGLTVQPKLVGFAMFFAINVAISALVARRRGEQRKEEANRLLFTVLCLILFAAVVISIIFGVFAGEILALCGSTPETHDSAVEYFRIIMGCMIFNCIQMGINAAQRGAGNTKITMRTNVTSNTINIIFNYLLIGGHFGFPALGITGAALATVLGTVVACVMSILSIMKKDNFVSIPYIIAAKIRPSWKAFKNLVQVGYSVFFEQLLMRIGFVLTAVMAADMGNDSMAAHQVGMNIMSLSFAFGDGLQATAVALIGRSLGEKNEEKAKDYGKVCRRIGSCGAFVLMLVYLFSARPLMSLFFDEWQVVDLGVGIMRVIVFVVAFQICQVIYMGCLRGAGDTFFTACVSTFSVTIVRTSFSYLGAYVFGLGIVGVWLGVLGDQVSRYILASIRYRQGKWTKIRI